MRLCGGMGVAEETDVTWQQAKHRTAVWLENGITMTPRHRGPWRWQTNEFTQVLTRVGCSFPFNTRRCVPSSG